MISLYVIPNDKPEVANIQRCTDSFEGLINNVLIMDNRNLCNVTDVEDSWWCFMFDNEYIDHNLRISIPSYIMNPHDEHHYFVFYKKDQWGRVFYAPRLFRRGVRLQEGPSMIPERPEHLKAGYIFDGWLLG